MYMPKQLDNVDIVRQPVHLGYVSDANVCVGSTLFICFGSVGIFYMDIRFFVWVLIWLSAMFECIDQFRCMDGMLYICLDEASTILVLFFRIHFFFVHASPSRNLEKTKSFLSLFFAEIARFILLAV